MNSAKRIFLALLAVAVLSAGCKKDEDVLADPATVNDTVKEGALGAGDTITLGAHKSPIGSYGALGTKEVLTIAQAKAATEKVSFVYDFVGDYAQMPILSSPTESEIKALPGVRETKFVLTSGVDFATATDADLAKFTPNLTSLINLATGDVIAFRTADGTTGFILVQSITKSIDGTSTFVVRMK